MNTARRIAIPALLICCAATAACSSVRVTDPPRTATEMLLLNQAVAEAIDKLSAAALRDRKVFVDGSYFVPADKNRDNIASDYLFTMGEVRAKLLREGVRLVNTRDQAQIVVEVRSGAHGIDKENLLVGLPSVTLPGLGGGAVSAAEPLIATPEIALVKNIKQDGVASIAIVAYWADTGELVAASGPFMGHTYRDDWWFFGYGPKTSGDIPTAQRRPNADAAPTTAPATQPTADSVPAGGGGLTRDSDR
jgi:hypothetical protein